MSIRYSDGLRQKLLGHKSWREVFSDFVINIYQGTAPASANTAPAGTLLCKYTENGAEVSAGEVSTPNTWCFTVSGHEPGTYKVAVTVDGVETTYTHDATASHASEDDIAIALATMLNDVMPLQAIAALHLVYVQTRVPGAAVTIAAGAGGTGSALTDFTEVIAEARSDAMSFGAPVAGVCNKTSGEVWKGTAVATGIGAYFRMVTSGDLGTTNSTDPRVQGSVSTGGADLNLASISFVIDQEYTLDGAEITQAALNA